MCCINYLKTSNSVSSNVFPCFLCSVFVSLAKKRKCQLFILQNLCPQQFHRSWVMPYLKLWQYLEKRVSHTVEVGQVSCETSCYTWQYKEEKCCVQVFMAIDYRGTLAHLFYQKTNCTSKKFYFPSLGLIHLLEGTLENYFILRLLIFFFLKKNSFWRISCMSTLYSHHFQPSLSHLQLTSFLWNFWSVLALLLLYIQYPHSPPTDTHTHTFVYSICRIHLQVIVYTCV